MSIENTLERIATALEAIAASGQGFLSEEIAIEPKSKKAPAAPKPPAAPSESKAAASTVDASTSTTPKAPTPPPAPPVVEHTAPPAAPSTSEAETLVVDSPEKCNGLLVAEYNRLGGTPEVMQRILGVMEANFKVRSVNDLTKEQYGPLITAVRAL